MRLMKSTVYWQQVYHGSVICQVNLERHGHGKEANRKMEGLSGFHKPHAHSILFELKNAGAAYQRLANMMFKNLLRNTMQVYIYDMVVKSKLKKDHVVHRDQVFLILRKFNIKLNPSKCAFRVFSRQFLAHIVSKRGVEANPTKIAKSRSLSNFKTKKNVQGLASRIATLSQMISRLSDRYKSLFDAIKKNKKTFSGMMSNSKLSKNQRIDGLATNLSFTRARRRFGLLSGNI